MKPIPARNLTGFLAIGCLSLALASMLGCTCKPEAEVNLPTDTPSPTTIPSPTLNGSTSIPKEVAELELDISLLTDSPCRAPCWHNITPGLSDESDVRAQLQDSPFVKEGTLRYRATEEADVPIGLFSWQAKGEHYNRIILRDQIVLRMEIWVDLEWTLGDAVDKFGPPEHILAYADCEEGCVHVVEFYYPTQGLEFESATLGGRSRRSIVSEDLRVTLGVYFAPTTLEGMMSEVYLCSPNRMEDWLVDIREWEGFED